ncbi:hypothetical protein BASA61_008111 [Batrachochytrium salamandrivorans]|nr:hypothetical protein BASA61_008111 [Batrachochytrium salamandrivorans]
MASVKRSARTVAAAVRCSTSINSKAGLSGLSSNSINPSNSNSSSSSTTTTTTAITASSRSLRHRTTAMACVASALSLPGSSVTSRNSNDNGSGAGTGSRTGSRTGTGTGSRTGTGTGTGAADVRRSVAGLSAALASLASTDRLDNCEQQDSSLQAIQQQRQLMASNTPKLTGHAMDTMNNASTTTAVVGSSSSNSNSNSSNSNTNNSNSRTHWRSLPTRSSHRISSSTLATRTNTRSSSVGGMDANLVCSSTGNNNIYNYSNSSNSGSNSGSNSSSSSSSNSNNDMTVTATNYPLGTASVASSQIQTTTVEATTAVTKTIPTATTTTAVINSILLLEPDMTATTTTTTAASSDPATRPVSCGSSPSAAVAVTHSTLCKRRCSHVVSMPALTRDGLSKGSTIPTTISTTIPTIGTTNTGNNPLVPFKQKPKFIAPPTPPHAASEVDDLQTVAIETALLYTRDDHEMKTSTSSRSEPLSPLLLNAVTTSNHPASTTTHTPARSSFRSNFKSALNSDPILTPVPKLELELESELRHNLQTLIP